MTPEDRIRAARSAGIELPVFLFDGDCGFCRRWADWLAARAGASIRFVPFQSVDHDALGLSGAALRSASYLVDEAGRAHGGSDGFAHALRHSSRRWALLARILRLPVLRTGGRWAYRVVARNRHRVPAPRSAG